MWAQDRPLRSECSFLRKASGQGMPPAGNNMIPQAADELGRKNALLENSKSEITEVRYIIVSWCVCMCVHIYTSVCIWSPLLGRAFFSLDRI